MNVERHFIFVYGFTKIIPVLCNGFMIVIKAVTEFIAAIQHIIFNIYKNKKYIKYN